MSAFLRSISSAFLLSVLSVPASASFFAIFFISAAGPIFLFFSIFFVFAFFFSIFSVPATFIFSVPATFLSISRIFLFLFILLILLVFLIFFVFSWSTSRSASIFFRICWYYFWSTSVIIIIIINCIWSSLIGCLSNWRTRVFRELLFWISISGILSIHFF